MLKNFLAAPITGLLCLLVVMGLGAGGLVHAQNGRSVITPENANLLVEQAVVDLGSRASYPSVVWSADSQWVAVPLGSDGLRVIETAQWAVAQSFAPVEASGVVVSAAFSPDGTRLATGETNRNDGTNTIHFWQMSDFTSTVSGTAPSLLNMAFLIDDQLWVGGTAGGVILMAQDGSTLVTMTDSSLLRPVLSPDVTRLAAYDVGGPQLYEVGAFLSTTPIGQIVTPIVPDDSVFSPDSRLLTVALDNRRDSELTPISGQIFDAQTGSPILTLAGEFINVRQPAFSPDGRLLAAAVCSSYDSELVFCQTPEIWVWDTATGQKVGGFILSPNTAVNGLSFSPDGTWLAAHLDDQLHIYGLGSENLPPAPTATPTLAPVTSDAGEPIVPTAGTYTLTSTATACDGYGVIAGAQTPTTHTVSVTKLPPASLEVKISGTMAGAPLFLLGGVAGRGSNTFQAYLFADGATTANFSEVQLALVSATEMGGSFQSAECVLDFTFTLVQSDTTAPTPSISLGVTGCQLTTATSANKRAAPSTDAEKVGTLVADQIGRVTGQITGTDGYIWYQLTDGAWVRSDVVDTNGLCGDVPFVTP